MNVKISGFVPLLLNSCSCSCCLLFQVRDYIHVVDLADGHIAALNKLDEPSIGQIPLFNLGILLQISIIRVDVKVLI